MAALRDIARDFAAEIRDGIGWTIIKNCRKGGA